LKLVPEGIEVPAEWRWFCGHCAAPPPGNEPPAPVARVCSACGLGLLLETREDFLPGGQDAFLVIDSALLVQGMSRHAERLLGIAEDLAVNRPVSELLVAAECEVRGLSVGGAIADALGGAGDGSAVHSFVRPWNTFGVRMRARISACGPPRAALLVLENTPASLRAV
jgi:hypothetical protein